MKLVIDGKDYELDADWLVGKWYEETVKYLDPEREEAKKITDIRLAAKGLLRIRLSAVLKIFAKIFNVPDWRDLQPKRGEDLLMTLHSYFALMMRAEAQNLVVETETEPDVLGDHTGTRLTLVRASFGEAVELYQRPDTGRQVSQSARPDTAALPEAAGSGLERDADPTEILVRSPLQP
jgi:hypothetical protein